VGVREAVGAGRRTAVAGLAWCLVMVRAVAGAVVSGVPAGARLRRAVESPAAGRRRDAAAAELRARLTEAAAAMSGARLGVTVFEDVALAQRRFAPRIFPARGRRDAAALRATLHATAYFGTDTDPDEVLGKLPAGAPELWRRHGDTVYGPASVVRLDHPDLPPGPAPGDSGTLADRAAGTSRVIRRRTVTEPPDTAVAAVRDRSRPVSRPVLRWSSQVTYLAVPRWPLLRRLAAAPRTDPDARR
jgi:hypothetical protein